MNVSTSQASNSIWDVEPSKQNAEETELEKVKFALLLYIQKFVNSPLPLHRVLGVVQELKNEEKSKSKYQIYF